MENKDLLKIFGVTVLALCFHQLVTAPVISKVTTKKPSAPATPATGK